MQRHGFFVQLGLRGMLAGLVIFGGGLDSIAAGADPSFYLKRSTWQETMLASQQARHAQRDQVTATNKIFMSGVLRGGDAPEYLQVSIAGWTNLYLIVHDNGDYHHDVANWAEAKLTVTGQLDLFLDTVEPKSARQGWGTFRRDNRSAVGGPLQIADRVFSRGLGTHANSVFHYRLDRSYDRFEAWTGVDISRGREGSVRFLVASEPVAPETLGSPQKLWTLVSRDFPDAEARRQMRWEQADHIWEAEWRQVSELAQRYAQAVRGPLAEQARQRAAHVKSPGELEAVRALYYRTRALEQSQSELKAFDFAALRRAINHLTTTYGKRYPKGPEYLRRLNELESRLAPLRDQPDEKIVEGVRSLRSLLAEALLANPLLDFDRLLLVRRGVNHLGLPQNWQGNSSLPRAGFDNEVAVLSPVKPGGKLTTLYRPSGSHFVGDVDLHFDADRLLFSSIGTRNRWQVFELRVDGTGLRQVTPGDQSDVDNYDACYLPDGGVMFCSTACFIGVPCVDGSDHVATLYRMDRDGRNIRQLCFDQDHNWCPTVLNNGRVLYQRWEYADTPHSQTRLLFHMNPDGTEQVEFYGSNSQWPNSKFYARPTPGHPTKVVTVVGGHHGVPRMGELVVLDPAKGRNEASGVVQRIPGYGKPVEPLIKDQLVNDSWPKFLHPYPLSEHFFLVSAQPTPESLWGIYIVDTFDNMLLLAELPGNALFEPVPLRKTPRPPVIPDQVNLASQEAVVHLHDIYHGDGLKGVPRGTVKQLRIFAYHWAYQGMGGLLGTIGLDGPWDTRRILGTVPVAADGSAYFRVPANTPISIQPLDAQGRAVQIMRSWMTAMPGEHVSCIGCHEQQNTAPPVRLAETRRNRQPNAIQEWHGPARPFSFAREVQPVLDRYCVGCHDDKPGYSGEALPDLRGTERITDFRMETPGQGGRLGGRFTVSYATLHRYVRRPGIESDYHLLKPMEYHASTTELVQMLQKGHHGVKLDAEAWDRLYTWIDLNAPFHGTWHEELHNPGQQRDRRRQLREQYAGGNEDPEAVPPVPAGPVQFVAPQYPISESAESLTAAGWPFDALTASNRQAAAGNSVRRQVRLAEGLTLDMVLIPAGEFLMGSLHGEMDERPLTRVRISRPFWMSCTEIRNDQYAVFDSSHDSHVESKTAYQFGVHGFPVNEPRQPVVRVSWFRAMAFCEWLSRQTGQAFTLPTEAQWEYACRAGNAGAFYYSGVTTDFSPYANFADAKLIEFASDPYTVFTPLQNPSPYEDYIPKDTRCNDGGLVTVPVGQYRPNAWGLHDMHGNVWEWTRSSYRRYPYAEEDGRNHPNHREQKVARGGSWRDRPWRGRSSFRLAYEPWQQVFNVGFRIVCEAGEVAEVNPAAKRAEVAQSQ